MDTGSPDPSSTAVGAQPLDRDVQRLLRSGPFADALDAVIEARGLSLERLRDHLRASGVTVSRTTLSYWRRGRNRPERDGSLDVITQLERILGLPASSLVVLLGPRRPRGRWLDHSPGGIASHRLWPSAGPIAAELAVSAAENGFEILSAHDLVMVDDARCERLQRTRLVIEAMAERVDHCLVYYQAEDPHRLPQLAKPRCCRIGRQRTDPESGLLVAELVLDRRLAAGEFAMIEYDVQMHPGKPVDNYHRRFSKPAREYVLQVQFGEAIPTRCHRFEQQTPGSPQRVMEPLWIGSTSAVSLVLRDVQAGIAGIRWDW